MLGRDISGNRTPHQDVDIESRNMGHFAPVLANSHLTHWKRLFIHVEIRIGHVWC
jgi:hypothetical protein